MQSPIVVLFLPVGPKQVSQIKNTKTASFVLLRHFFTVKRTNWALFVLLEMPGGLYCHSGPHQHCHVERHQHCHAEPHQHYYASRHQHCHVERPTGVETSVTRFLHSLRSVEMTSNSRTVMSGHICTFMSVDISTVMSSDQRESRHL